MSERERRERQERIDGVQVQWREIVHKAKMTPEEAVSCAAEFLAIVIISATQIESQAHEVLNQTTDNGHTYINENWRESRIAAAKAGRQ